MSLKTNFSTNLLWQESPLFFYLMSIFGLLYTKCEVNLGGLNIGGFMAMGQAIA